MLGANASMCCIINQINNNGEPSNLLSLAITELEISIKLTNQYLKVRDTYWNINRVGYKKGVKARINILAFNAYTHFLTAIDYLNKYADTKDNIPCPSWWCEVMVSLAVADNDFKNSPSINNVQLELELCLKNTKK